LRIEQFLPASFDHPLWSVSSPASPASLMSLTPGYGEAPLSDDELAALLPDVVHILGEPVTRVAVYDLEQGIREQVAEQLLTAALEACCSSMNR
jgi:hypothetical protein